MTFITWENWTELELPRGIVWCVAGTCVCSFVVGAACRANGCFLSAGQQVWPGVWASSVPAGRVGFRAMPLPSTHLFGKCCVNVVRRFWQWQFKTNLSSAGFSYWVDSDWKCFNTLELRGRVLVCKHINIHTCKCVKQKIENNNNPFLTIQSVPHYIYFFLVLILLDFTLISH